MANYLIYNLDTGDWTEVSDGENKTATDSRISIGFAGEAAKVLQSLVETTGRTVREVIMDAIMLEREVAEVAKNEGRVVFVDKGMKEVRELILESRR